MTPNSDNNYLEFEEKSLIQIDFKPTARLVQQIARMERCAGQWDRLSESPALATPESVTRSIERGSVLASRLEPFSSESDRQRFISAHLFSRAFPTNPTDLQAFQAQLGDCEWRRINGALSAPAAFFPQEAVFSTTPPFLIPQRLDELLQWLNLEMEESSWHPALTIGSFHILFLQLSPFAVANHRLSLLLVWQLLCDHGFGFVRYHHFLEPLSGREQSYFSALRQAEKTARGNWSTLNAWLELFLGLLSQSAEDLLRECGWEAQRLGLTDTQLAVLAAVREFGTATRDRVSTETGIALSTVKYSLGVLTARGFVRRNGAGRTTNYSAI